jgi:hypothetical protein
MLLRMLKRDQSIIVSPRDSEQSIHSNIASFRTVCNWRFNRFLNYRTCQCGHKFNRSHISCYLPGSSLYDSHFSSLSFQRSVKNLSTFASNIKNYGVLDFILNSSSYADFLSLFDQLQRLLDC